MLLLGSEKHFDLQKGDSFCSNTYKRIKGGQGQLHPDHHTMENKMDTKTYVKGLYDRISIKTWSQECDDTSRRIKVLPAVWKAQLYVF